MSSSLARTRSLRKPTQGSSTDLPPTSTSNSTSTSTVNTAAAAPAPAPPTTSTQRPVSPSRLPAPRSLAATRPTTRSVSGASVASTKSGASDAAAAAAKKKRANPLSTLLSRPASTRQTPGTTSATRPRDAAAAAAAAAGGPPSAPPSRTNALSGLTRPSSTREPAPTRPRHPPAPSSSSSSTPAGAATGTRSTTATTRPTTSSGVPSSKLTSAASSATSSPTKGHARARSVATLNGSTILRPPGQPSASDRTTRSRPTSLYGAPPTSSSTATTTTTAAATRPRPPSATDRFATKPSSVSSLSSTTTSSTTTAAATTTTTTRTRSSRTASTSTAPAKPHQQARPPSSSSHSPTSPPRQPPKPAAGALRPFFNTLQQHYSPAKSLAPKPLTATYLAPPSPSKLPSNVALSAETARLQTELLQLHLLHRDLPQTTAAWHASARDKLAARHASLGRSAADLARQEAEAAERLNIAALRRWGSHRHHSSSSSSSPATIAATTLEDKIQRLDALLASLWSLDTPGGKHHRLVRAFERWASALPDLEAARARAEDQGDPEALLDADSQVRFGGALDARWKEDAAALVRKLEGWRAQLRELEYRDEEESDDDGGDGDGGKTRVSSRSSLERLLDGCGSLIKDMLDELAVMEEIEAVAVEREAEWIRRMNRQGEDGRGKDTPRAGAVWRVV
ncbi:hypothetical protein CH35J_004280 [Colletotrichum higginsianum]|uniref:Aga1 a-agglutinin anchor subunit n=1 Tax=Colletotrichum higginsianum TaxID=80884 RepID=A0A4T0WAZ6_9PEZI|nr:hypothetical protein CH35J_004280 [Colletotrichum higginsianum]